MTAAEFSRLVEQPSLVKDVAVADLRDLVSRYPYCASFHLLLIKKYQLEKHPDFDARLSVTAAYANDRKALYRLLYDESKFTPLEETVTATEEQRVGAEILLGNETGAFSDYTPKNKLAEIETYETMDFVKSGWADDLRSLENENTDQLSEELQKQFALASETAGGGAEINHDFDDLEEDNADELIEENVAFELESTKALDEAIEDSVEEYEYRELATASSATAEITHRFDNLEEEKDDLLEEDLDAEIESTKALEGAIEHAVAEPNYDQLAETIKQNGTADLHELSEYGENISAANSSGDTVSVPTQDKPDEAIPQQQREMPTDPLEHSNVEREESPSPKEEITSEPQLPEEQLIPDSTKAFEPSESLAQLLTGGNDESEVEEVLKDDIGHETLTEANASTEIQETIETEIPSGNEQTIEEENFVALGETALQEVREEANLPTSLEEHEVKPEEIHQAVENQETNEIAALTPRQELNSPIAEEDLVGTIHQKITHETEAAYRNDDQLVTMSHQAVSTEGTRSFLDWLRMFNPKQEDSSQNNFEKQARTPLEQNHAAAIPPAIQPTVDEAQNAEDDLYDREWQARKLEMESWTAGLPDELKVIDEFVAEQSSEKPNIPPQKTVAELAQKSLEQNDEFLTETMAKVYAAQGKYKKAAEVLEKLMLKNPSKRPYFADLLEEFKKKITPQ